MSQFDKPLEGDGEDKNFLEKEIERNAKASHEIHEQLEEKMKSLSPEDREQINEMYSRIARRYDEVVLSEAKEWSQKIEEAGTPARRQMIIFNILSIGEMETYLRDSSLSSKTQDEIKEMINKARMEAGLPPKYAV